MLLLLLLLPPLPVSWGIGSEKKTFRPYRTIASPKTEMGFVEGRRAVGGVKE